MAEALGVAASIIAVIELTDRVVELCKAYIGSATEASKDLRRILAEVSAVKTILENLQFSRDIDTQFGGVLQALERQHGVVSQCFRCVAELERLFPPDIRTDFGPGWAAGLALGKGKGKGKERMQRVLTSLSWPLKEPKAKKLLEELATHKLNLNLILTTESIQDVKGVKMGVQRLEESLSAIIIVPSLGGLREGGTGEWILERDLFKQWVNHAGPHRGLWMHGIPGAGKTVLASRIIDYLNKADETCASAGASRTKLVVYYYCSYLRRQDEGEDLLRWLICQLCRHTSTTPEKLFKAFQSDCEPSIDDLLGLLIQCLEPMEEEVYVVVDALDESQPRGKLFRVLAAMMADKGMSKINLLATSRQYVDIETALAGTGAWAVLPLEATDMQQDIWKFVSSSLAEPRFCRWPQDLRYEMQDALTNGAQGMFRWVVCQLDVLRRLRSADQIRATIQRLPKTLEETYDMIFSLLPEEDLDLVRTVLTLICGHVEADVEKASQWPYDALELAMQHLKGSEFYSIGDLREVCGCLITVDTPWTDPDHPDNDQIVFLSHYTVEEFLYSDAIGRGRFASLALDPDDGRRSYLQTLHRLARYCPVSHWPDVVADTTTVPGQLNKFYHERICHYIFWWYPEIADDDELATQALEYLHKSRRCYYDLARHITSEVIVIEPQELGPNAAMFLWFIYILEVEDEHYIQSNLLWPRFIDSCDMAALMEEEVSWCVRERKPDMDKIYSSTPDDYRELDRRHGKLCEYLEESSRWATGYMPHDSFMQTLQCLVEVHNHDQTCKDSNSFLARLLSAPYAKTDFPFDAEYRLAKIVDADRDVAAKPRWLPTWHRYRDYEVKLFLAAILKENVDLEGVKILLHACFDPSVAITKESVTKGNWRLRAPIPPMLNPEEGNSAYITDFPVCADPDHQHSQVEASQRAEVQRLLADAVEQLKTLPRADTRFLEVVQRRYLLGEVEDLKELSRRRK
ncbi:hypothetical protein PG984_011835 [Apiospora sp. TS-2023a]